MNSIVYIDLYPGLPRERGMNPENLRRDNLVRERNCCNKMAELGSEERTSEDLCVLVVDD
jgi:hypothetical protein